MEGMTPQDPAQRKPAALCQAVALYGLAGILGTCRHINAVGPHQGRNSPLIEGHDHKCGFGSRRLRARLAHVRCRPWRASSAGRQPQARVSCHGFPPWRRESRHSRHAACHRHAPPLGGRACNGCGRRHCQDALAGRGGPGRGPWSRLATRMRRRELLILFPREKTSSKSCFDLMVFMLCYLDGELVTALGTTTSEHGTAALGCHTSTEAVGGGALALVGLIGTLHSYSSRLGLDVSNRAISPKIVRVSTSRCQFPSRTHPAHIHNLFRGHRGRTPPLADRLSGNTICSEIATAGTSRREKSPQTVATLMKETFHRSVQCGGTR